MHAFSATDTMAAPVSRKNLYVSGGHTLEAPTQRHAPIIIYYLLLGEIQFTNINLIASTIHVYSKRRCENSSAAVINGCHANWIAHYRILRGEILVFWADFSVRISTGLADLKQRFSQNTLILVQISFGFTETTSRFENKNRSGTMKNRWGAPESATNANINTTMFL